jgi:NAD+ kinase
MKASHDNHSRALASLRRTLQRRGVEVDARWRAQVRSARSFDLVISLGGDGTLLDSSHRVLDDTPLIGINSDPGRSVGALCYGNLAALPRVLDRLEAGTLRPTRINRMRVRVDGKEVLGPTLNDVLFAHECPAGLTRFDRAVVPADRALQTRPERTPRRFRKLRGSGLWVSTAMGSTAAIRSAGGRPMRPRSRRLQFLVREPYAPPGAAPRPGLRGFVGPDEALVLINRLRRGMLWADGVHRCLGLRYGQQVVLDRHPASLRLVLDL